MVINEKGLLRAMKEAHKVTGYTVAVENQGGIDNLIITTNKFAVVMEKKNTPPKIRGLIAEHLLDFPRVGEAYEVKKKEPQMEIYDAATSFIRNVHAGDKPLQIIKRTNLTMCGYTLWQRKSDLKMFEVDPELEDIMNLARCTARIVGEETLMLDDLESRAYITVQKIDANGQKMIDHLSQIQWVAM